MKNDSPRDLEQPSPILPHKRARRIESRVARSTPEQSGVAESGPAAAKGAAKLPLRCRSSSRFPLSLNFLGRSRAASEARGFLRVVIGVVRMPR